MAHLYRNTRIHQVFGANTDVGKTIITTALVRASASKQRSVQYLKPISTGPLLEADDIFIKRHTSTYRSSISQACLFRLKEPVSPHLAYNLEREQRGDAVTPWLKDSDIIHAVRSHLRESVSSEPGRSDIYLETAGGVHSPILTGTCQVDFYRPLRLPTVLVGDSKLGGISTTISAYESLLVRGYDIDAIALFKDDYYANWKYLKEFFGKRSVFLMAIPPPPPIHPVPDENQEITEEYFAKRDSDGSSDALVEHLDLCHEKRIGDLLSMGERAVDKLWWPFVQHGLVKDERNVTVIDSAHGDFFQVSIGGAMSHSEVDVRQTGNLLKNMLDGSASWWTQTFGHSHPSLTFAAARAAGRYGHVMYPQAVHSPSLRLAERLLGDGPGKDWAARAFYSDNGSTAMEVAIKMALRAYCNTHGMELNAEEKERLGVLGLRGSYHGDTIGVMNACEKAGVYTCEWHSSKGYWIDAPSVVIRSGKTFIDIPDSITSSSQLKEADITFTSPGFVYDVHSRMDSQLAYLYEGHIQSCLHAIKERGSPLLATLILEPLILGAGGMKFVDPLFQRILVENFRNTTKQSGAWSGLPVIFDEVFVGLYRAGWASCIPVLGVTPDIAVYAKMLTGGLIPLAVTLASQHIFDSFVSESKADALLHGHSYTAHPMGCEVANATLSLMDERVNSNDWTSMKRAWSPPTTSDRVSQGSCMWSFWDPSFINSASCFPSIEGVMTLGTVLAIKFKGSAEGYQSHLAESRLASISHLLENELTDFTVHFRTLGDVAYFITSLNTPSDIVRKLETKILEILT